MRSLPRETLKTLNLNDNAINDYGLEALCVYVHPLSAPPRRGGRQMRVHPYLKIQMKGEKSHKIEENDPQAHVQHRNHLHPCPPISPSQPAALLHLSLENNKLGDRLICRLVDALEHSRLKTLNLSKNHLGQSSAVRMGKLFEDGRLSSLEQLIVSWNLIRGFGAAKLFEGFASSRINTFDISWNTLGSTSNAASNKMMREAVRALANALKVNRCCVHLDLSHNALDDEDCKLIADGLRVNHTVLM
jgi:Ran GTPase-activating protein (RanGAP) involved in mRNA processing and transport